MQAKKDERKTDECAGERRVRTHIKILTIFSLLVLFDKSSYRTVIASQEVYVSRTLETDISIIIDILHRVPGTDQEALALHWDDIIADPDRTSMIFEQTPVVLPNLLVSVQTPFCGRALSHRAPPSFCPATTTTHPPTPIFG